MELRNLKTFIRVAELNSFTRAAEQLSYAQSTVTAQIESLEKELGIDLFIRNGKRICLSSSGKDLLKYAQYMHAIENEVHSHFHENSEPTGTIHIGILESISAAPYIECLAKFLKKYPKVRLKVKIDTTVHLRRMLQKGELDIVVILDFLLPDPSLQLIYNKAVSIIFFTAYDSELLKTSTIHLKDLVNETWLLTEKGCNYRKLLEDDLATKKLYITDRLEIGVTKTIIDFVSQGLGISLLPNFNLTQALTKKIIASIPVVDYHMEMNIQILVGNDRWLPPSIKYLSEYFIKQFESS